MRFELARRRVSRMTEGAGGAGDRDWRACLSHDESDGAVYDDLRIIEADLRNQYRLIYKPPDWQGSREMIQTRPFAQS
jgi:hypothetical protein